MNPLGAKRRYISVSRLLDWNAERSGIVRLLWREALEASETTERGYAPAPYSGDLEVGHHGNEPSETLDGLLVLCSGS